MKYFAYGSNMSERRLRERVPGAERIGVYTLFAHSLRFHKLSSDGSGKCDALFTGSSYDYVIGALFEISDEEKKDLDRAEGLGYGYEQKIVSLIDAKGNDLNAITYYATRTDPSLLPYTWYLYHVIHGANETGVPVDYLSFIQRTESKKDPDMNRDAKERAIYK